MKRRPDPIATMIAEERRVVLAVAAELHVPYQDHADIMNEAVLRGLTALARGKLVVIGEATDQRAAVRSFLCTVARRIIWNRRHRDRLTEMTREPVEPFDPMPRFEARSELRALDLSPVSVAFFQAIVHEGNVLRAARRLGWPQGTAYSRLNALRADAHNARRRIRRK